MYSDTACYNSVARRENMRLKSYCGVSISENLSLVSGDCCRIRTYPSDMGCNVVYVVELAICRLHSLLSKTHFEIASVRVDS